MSYLFKPTRLYIKQCPHCGMKYFGKYTGDHIETYRGSGVRWKRHLKKHNVKPTHLWHSDWYHHKELIKKFAVRFSNLNNIVESTDWANLKIEDGLGGGWSHYNGTDRHIEQCRINGNMTGPLNGKNSYKNKTGIHGMSPDAKTVSSRKGGLSTHSKYPGMLNRATLTEEAIKNKRNKLREIKHQQGEKNSQYGTRWIHSYTEKRSKKISKNDPLPQGWLEGRKIKF